MSDLLDHALKEKYNSMKINDPLTFVKNAIDWDAFTPLLSDLYHNDTDNGGRPNIPVKTMIKVLFQQSTFNNMVDEQAETLIKDRISFMNFLEFQISILMQESYSYSVRDYLRPDLTGSYVICSLYHLDTYNRDIILLKVYKGSPEGVFEPPVHSRR